MFIVQAIDLFHTGPKRQHYHVQNRRSGSHLGTELSRAGEAVEVGALSFPSGPRRPEKAGVFGFWIS
jgi:hypothetical protein